MAFLLKLKNSICFPIIKKHIPQLYLQTASITSNQSLTDVSEEDGVRRIVLNNPKKRNALSLLMLETLLENVNKDIDNLRCIVISSRGPVFSSGHDLKELTSSTGQEYHQKVFATCSVFMKRLQTLPVPVIVQVNGLAAAAGCQLVATSDISICSERSQFSTPGANIGLFCSTPGIPLVRAVPRKIASYMLFTGRPISSQEALQNGLVSLVVPESLLETTTQEVVNDILIKSRSVIKLGKEFFYRQLQYPLDQAYSEGEQVMVKNLGLNDGQKGLNAFFKKSRPSWTHADS